MLIVAIIVAACIIAAAITMAATRVADALNANHAIMTSLKEEVYLLQIGLFKARMLAVEELERAEKVRLDRAREIEKRRCDKAVRKGGCANTFWLGFVRYVIAKKRPGLARP